MAVATRALGTTGIEVPVVGLGAGRIGDPDQDEREIERLLHHAVDRGVTFIDTARSYGASEERIGRFLAHRRDEVVLSTKIGYGIEGVSDWTPECVRRGVDRALAVLGTDRIDVVFFHSCPRETLERGDCTEALQRAVQAGKVRAPGYSGEGDALALAIDSGVFTVVQTSVSIADQSGLDGPISRAGVRGIGVIAKRPLANVAWRHRARPDAPDTSIYWDRLRAMEGDLGPLREGDVLRFAAFAPGVSSAIVGTSSIAHLDAAIEAAARGPLDEQNVRRWRAAFQHASAGAWDGVV
jgi:aryl-alcohol dehydrogenase-like predicted oxidoreductase